MNQGAAIFEAEYCNYRRPVVDRVTAYIRVLVMNSTPQGKTHMIRPFSFNHKRQDSERAACPSESSRRTV